MPHLVVGGQGPSINYVRIFSRFLDPPTHPVALSTHLKDPPPPLGYIQLGI